MEVDTVLSDFESSDFGEMVRKHTSTAVKRYILLYPCHLLGMDIYHNNLANYK